MKNVPDKKQALKSNNDSQNNPDLNNESQKSISNTIRQNSEIKDCKLEIEGSDESGVTYASETYTEDIFEESYTDDEYSDNEDAWADSDDASIDEKCLDLEEGDSKKRFKRNEDSKIDLRQTIFIAQCKIKLFKIIDGVSIVVDTFNLIYISKDNFGIIKTYKLKYFKITDFIKIDDVVYFCSETSGIIYSLNIETEEICRINKHIRNNIKFMLDRTRDRICILGEKLAMLTTKFDVVNVFSGEFVGVCKFHNHVLALKSTGEILVFNYDLKFVKEVILENKFTFKTLYATDTNIIIGTDMGIIIFDGNFNKIKELCNIQQEPTVFQYTNKYILYATNSLQSLRIIHQNSFAFFNNFPYKSLKFGSIQSIVLKENKIYIALNSEIFEYDIANE